MNRHIDEIIGKKILEELDKEIESLLINYLDESRKERNGFLLNEYENLRKEKGIIKLALAYKISSFLKSNDAYYEVLGPLTSSCLAYELGIHPIDTLKYGIDERMANEVDYSIDLVIPSIMKGKTKDYVLDSLLDIKPFCVYKSVEDKEHIIDGCFVYPLEEDTLKEASSIADESDMEIKKCFLDTYVRSHKEKFIRINLFQREVVDLIDKARNEFEDREYACFEVTSLNQLIEKGCKSILFDSDLDRPFDSFCDLCDYLSTKKGNFVDGRKAKSILTKDDLFAYLKKQYNDEEALDLALSTAYRFNAKKEDELSNVIFLWRRSEIIELASKLCLVARLAMNDLEKTYEMMLSDKANKKGIIEIDSSSDLDAYSKSRAALFSNLLDEYQLNVASRKVGPFFDIDGMIIAHCDDMVDDEDLDFINSSMGHFDFFNMFKKPLMKKEYSMYPRGRVLYDKKKKMFIVYGDKSILKNKEHLEEIRRFYKLPKYNVIFKKDEHYQVLDY